MKLPQLTIYFFFIQVTYQQIRTTLLNINNDKKLEQNQEITFKNYTMYDGCVQGFKKEMLEVLSTKGSPSFFENQEFEKTDVEFEKRFPLIFKIKTIEKNTVTLTSEARCHIYEDPYNFYNEYGLPSKKLNFSYTFPEIIVQLPYHRKNGDLKEEKISTVKNYSNVINILDVCKSEEMLESHSYKYYDIIKEEGFSEFNGVEIDPKEREFAPFSSKLDNIIKEFVVKKKSFQN